MDLLLAVDVEHHKTAGGTSTLIYWLSTAPVHNEKDIRIRARRDQKLDLIKITTKKKIQSMNNWMKKWWWIRAGKYYWKTMDKIKFTSINKALCLDRPQLSKSFRKSENTRLFPIFLLASAHTSTQSIAVPHTSSIICLSCFHSFRYNRHEDLKPWPSLMTLAIPDWFWICNFQNHQLKQIWTYMLPESTHPKEKKKINLLRP